MNDRHRSARSAPDTGSPGRQDAAFAAIAPTYRWRTPYPQGLIAALAARYGLAGGQRVLDLGAGTGHLAIPLARAGSEVIALDCVPAMIAHGARNAAVAGVGHRIRWVLAAADELPVLDIGTVRLAVAACSMHWMDMPQALADLGDRIDSGGGVAIVDSRRPADYPRPPWQVAADEVRDRWASRRSVEAVGSRRATPVDTAALLEASAFGDLIYRRWEETIERPLEAVVGLQYSYAPTSPAALGGNQVQYEIELREALKAACPNGVFTDRRHTEAWMGLRPEAAPRRAGPRGSRAEETAPGTTTFPRTETSDDATVDQATP